MIRWLLFPLLALIWIAVGCAAGRVDLDQAEPVFEDRPTGNTDTEQGTALPATPFSGTDIEPVEDGSEEENEDMSLETPSNPEPAATGAPMSLAETERLLKAELATKLGVPVEQIETRETEARTWLDQALGCGDRRTVVESLPVAGYLIVLAHENQTFEYHADQAGNFKLCLDTGDVGKPLDPIK